MDRMKERVINVFEAPFKSRGLGELLENNQDLVRMYEAIVGGIISSVWGNSGGKITVKDLDRLEDAISVITQQFTDAILARTPKFGEAEQMSLLELNAKKESNISIDMRELAKEYQEIAYDAVKDEVKNNPTDENIDAYLDMLNS